MSKIIKNIETTLGATEINPINVKWDLAIDTENDKNRWVDKIHRVQIALFDKHGVDATDQFSGSYYSQNLRSMLDDKLLEAVEDLIIEEIEKEAEYA